MRKPEFILIPIGGHIHSSNLLAIWSLIIMLLGNQPIFSLMNITWRKNSLLWILLLTIGVFYHISFCSCLTALNHGKIITERPQWLIALFRKASKHQNEIIFSILETIYGRTCNLYLIELKSLITYI